MSRAILKRELTGRQLEVVMLVAERLTVNQIAQRLRIKKKTADRHIYLLAKKIPGTLPAMSRIRVWWAEGSELALGVPALR